ncbi:uncharacterized protein LOC132718812 [Ruditapes philippinarum]|uniref:uncharacterized protein LOC132718812 n=1 Tax=Ruditapes philippinarum TaxID=129788 RepID=UPI00295C097A|nr:uncharacterized protein LOC132718812 [Ruditapes philippinarum]
MNSNTCFLFGFFSVILVTCVVTGTVPPSAPEFVGLQDIDDCKKCIVGSDKENIQVHCKTSGGTPPVDVIVTVGDNSFITIPYAVDVSVNIAFITLADSYHNTTITCSVMNDALLSPLITTAKVYVISKLCFIIDINQSNYFF